MLTVIYAVLIFCLLIFVHEFGHLIAAKACGVRVNEFALGMGPRILHKKGKETEYSLRIFPVGGYCKMEGEDEDSPDPRAFNRRPAWARAIILAAGSLMNLFTAVILVSIMLLCIGMTTNIIGTVTEGYPAEEAGLQAGDEIVMIDGEETESWADVTTAITSCEDGALDMTVERDGERLEFAVPTMISEDDGRNVIGIVTKPTRNVGAALGGGWVCIAEWTGAMFHYLGQLFTGEGSVNDLVGPVGIVSIINDQAKLGIMYVINLAALLSLNLAIINMLPLPALDGGRLLFLVIQGITRKKISEEAEGKIHFVGLMLLMLLMVVLVFKDVNQFILH